MSKTVLVNVIVGDGVSRSLELDINKGFDLIDELPFTEADRKALIGALCGPNVAFERRHSGSEFRI